VTDTVPDKFTNDETRHKSANELERTREELERVRKRLDSVTKMARLAYWEYDIINDIYTFNDQFYRIFRTTAEQTGGYNMSFEAYVHRFIHPDDRPNVLAEGQRTKGSDYTRPDRQIEHRIIYPDGGVGYIAATFFMVTDLDGKPARVYGVTQDITEQKLAERERLANLHYFESMDKVNRAIQGAGDLERMMRDVLDVVLACYDCDRTFLLYPCDPDAEAWSVPMTRNKPEYPGKFKTGSELPMKKPMAGMIQAALDAGDALNLGPGSAHPLPEGVSENFHAKSSIVMALYPKTGKPWLLGIHQCSHPRAWTKEEKKLCQGIGRRIEDALTGLLISRDLQKSEGFLGNILANIPDTILVKDAEDLKIVSFNRAFEKLTGFSGEELIGKTAIDLMPEHIAREWEEADRAVLDKGTPVDIPEETIHNRKGEPRAIHTQKIPIPDETGKPKYLLIIGEDVTEYKKLQAQLNQTYKMEALGVMSGGIAHDFNNILQPMLGFCEFLRDDMPADSPQQAYVDGIFKSSLRARDLVNQILAFSRQSDRKTIPVDLKLLLKEALKLCRSTFSASIDIILDIHQDCVPVMADPTQLHQIIMNLMVNACHAMEQADGKIVVRLKETQLAEEDLKGTPLPPGNYAQLSISDTGCGMAPDVMQRIFDPYFTTKAQGKGTGLGLAVVYGIVKEHGGHINVYSEIDKGSTFNVYLPLAEKEIEAEAKEPAAIPQATGHEHILLVDDEEMIVELVSETLRRFGYRVTSSRNGADALALFKRTPKAFDLVITDMNMPNMTGDRLAGEMMAIRQEVPIIICTGFSERISREEAQAIGVRDFLMKPVAISELSEKVRKALDDSPPAPE
jgi:PAS domain S-box-containing protein